MNKSEFGVARARSLCEWGIRFGSSNSEPVLEQEGQIKSCKYLRLQLQEALENMEKTHET